MKYISNDEFNNIMTENEELFGEYQNVKFAAKINGNLLKLLVIVYLIVKTLNILLLNLKKDM